MKMELHIGDEIKKELAIQERFVAWLASKIDYDSSNLHKLLMSPNIKHKRLYEISKALKKDFFSLYSQQLSEEK